MAGTSVFSPSTTGFSWQISGLSNDFNSTYYQYAYVTVETSAGSYVGSSSPVYSGTTGTNTFVNGSYGGSLTAGQTYNVYGWVVVASGGTFSTGGTTATIPTPPPGNISGAFASASTSGVLITWTSGSNTTDCNVFVSGVGNYNGSTSSQYISYPFTAGSTYSYSITPFNGFIEGTTYSSSFTVPLTPPSGLTGLTAATNNGYVHLQWNASSGATNYNISWSGYSSGSASTSSTSSDVFLPNSHTWTFTVTPTNAGGSGSSQSVSGSTSNRPANFSWTTAKVSGQNFNLTATEWSSFKNTINGFRDYAGLAPYSFTTSSTGANFTATMFNQAVTAINDMSPPTAIPSGTASSKSTGQDVYASYLNNLVTSLNSIV